MRSSALRRLASVADGPVWRDPAPKAPLRPRRGPRSHLPKLQADGGGRRRQPAIVGASGAYAAWQRELPDARTSAIRGRLRACPTSRSGRSRRRRSMTSPLSSSGESVERLRRQRPDREVGHARKVPLIRTSMRDLASNPVRTIRRCHRVACLYRRPPSSRDRCGLRRGRSRALGARSRQAGSPATRASRTRRPHSLEPAAPDGPRSWPLGRRDARGPVRRECGPPMPTPSRASRSSKWAITCISLCAVRASRGRRCRSARQPRRQIIRPDNLPSQRVGGEHRAPAGAASVQERRWAPTCDRCAEDRRSGPDLRPSWVRSDRAAARSAPEGKDPPWTTASS